jgi:hypothetical protein
MLVPHRAPPSNKTVTSDEKLRLILKELTEMD